MNRIPRMMIVAALAGSALVAPAVSEARTDVSITFGPPPPVVEVVPAPRYGYVWAPGYWDWSGHRHVWHKGAYVRERHGYRWEPHRWVQDGDHWRMDRGHWNRNG